MVERQTGLIVTGVVVLLVAIGGVSAFAGIGPFGGDEPESVYDGIPNEANTVAYADPIGFSEDPTTEDVANHYLETAGAQDTTYEEAREQYKDQLDTQLQRTTDQLGTDAQISVDDVGEMAAFAKVQETQDVSNPYQGDYTAVVFELDITEDEFEELANSAVEESSDSQTTGNAEVTEYNGHTMLVIEQGQDQTSAIALLEEGTHVAGNREAVEDSIDTWNGDMERIDSSLIPESDAENTYFGFSSEVNDDLQQQINQGLESNPDVETVTGTYATNGEDEVYVDVRVTTSTEEAAQSLVEEIRQQRENSQASQIENINIGVEETSVTIRYEATTEEINGVIDEFLGQTQTQTAPSIAG